MGVRILALICLLFGLLACEKDLTGAKGEGGIKGEQGQTGEDYEIYTKSFAVDSLDWRIDGYTPYYKCNLIDSNLTQDVIDNSLVLLYYVDEKGKYLCPYSSYSFPNSFSIQYAILEGRILINLQKDLVTPDVPPGKMDFELIVTDE